MMMAFGRILQKVQQEPGQHFHLLWLIPQQPVAVKIHSP